MARERVGLLEEHPSSPQPIESSGERAALGDGDAALRREVGLALETFISDDPDVVGWAILWERIADQSVLVEDSLDRVGDVLRGEFLVPAIGASIDFSIAPDGYSLNLEGRAPTHSLGSIRFQSAIAFVGGREELSAVHGSVQLRPEAGHTFQDEGPVGYIFSSRDGDSSVQPLEYATLPDGQRGMIAPPPGGGEVVEGGYLGPGHTWLAKLAQVERTMMMSSSEE
jgi:hypothetical protein